MADMDTYDGDQRGYEDDRDYGRERSRSPGPDRDRDGDARIRDEPMNGRAERDPPQDKNGGLENATNSGSNLFVTGIHPRLSEEQIRELFGEYGVVEKCNIMRDPHTRESRGFGFVNMATPEDADLAKDKLQGHQYEGRTLSIEKARRARPRTPTPGKYFGPPKREDDRPPRGGGYRDRYDDRGYGGGRRDDRRGGGGYRDRYDDRGYGGGGGRRDDYARSDRDRHAPRSDDRYGDRRGGGGGGGGYGGGGGGGSGSGGGGYDRPPRGPPPEQASGGGYSGHPRDAAPREDYGRRRDYD